MWALVKDGSVDTVYSRAIAATIGDIKYPKTIFTLWAESQRKAIGIYDIVRKDRPDQAFYDRGTSSYSYNSDTDKVVENFDITEKKLTDLKINHTEATKNQGDLKIRAYGWLVERYILDNSKTIPDAVKTYATAVRSHCATICSAIDGCSDLDAFKTVHAKMYDDDGEYKTGWPDESSIIGYKRMR